MAVLCLLLLCGCAGFFGPAGDSSGSQASASPGDQGNTTETAGGTSGQPGETGTGEPSGGTISRLSGSVYEAGEGTLTVVDEKGNLYTFILNEQALVLDCQSIERGYPVTVSYLGALDGSGDCTDADVITIWVSDYRGLSPEEEAAHIMSVMTTEEKVGQMFLARCPEQDAAVLAAQYGLGGYVLFGRNFSGKTAQEIMETIAGYQAASAVPMIISVDEEGGTVCRVSGNPLLRSTRFKSPQQVYAAGGWDALAADTAEKCALLKSLGVNVNLSPVCDVCTDKNAFMYNRSFGQDAQQTSQYVSLVVSVMGENRMGAVLKHFPGYGNNADTHVGSSIDTRSPDSFRTSDFLPFSAGIDAGAGAVLVSHVVASAMDGAMPSSLSTEVHRVLREELGFNGVIVTDDLSMDAVTSYADADKVAVLAVLAGNDLLCCTDFETQVPAVLAAVQSGCIPMDNINASVMRILMWKIELGIIP
jgi:beta-N-acetylhexosaminidase